MTTLAHTAHIQRELATAPALGRRWQAVQKATSRVFYRIADAIYASRSKRAQREIAHHFASRGMPLTDAAEREMAARFMAGGWLRR